MYGKVGRQVLSNGVVAMPTMDKGGNLVSAGGGKYAEATMAGRMFCAAMQTPTTTSTTLNTTFVGFSLCNPSNSNRNIIVHGFSWGATAALTNETLLALATTTDSGIAADVVPRCCKYGANTSVALCDKGATIVAPVIERIVATLGSAADANMAPAPAPGYLDLDGSIVLPPGRALVTDTTVVTGAVLQFGFLWEEVDV